MPSDFPDWDAVCSHIRQYTTLFNSYMAISEPVEDESIKTAAIAFDMNSGTPIQFHIAPTFWAGLDLEQKQALVTHELLHIVLNHGKRYKNFLELNYTYHKPEQLMSLANVAADLALNTFMSASYEIPINTIESLSGLHLIDTDHMRNLCATGDPSGNLVNLLRSASSYTKRGFVDYAALNHSYGTTFEYIFDRLYKYKHISSTNDAFDDLVSSDGWWLEIDDKVLDALTSALERVSEENNQQNKPSLSEISELKAGIDEGTTLLSPFLERMYDMNTRNWERVIRHWVHKADDFAVNVESWVRDNPRMASMESSYLLPNEVDIFDEVRRRIDVAVFLDFSGSCLDYVTEFASVAASLPAYNFIIKGYVFDTKIKPVDFYTLRKNKSLRAGGGTLFNPIEATLQQLPKYPSAVFVMTDGAGDRVIPKHPERWHVFLVGSAASKTELESAEKAGTWCFNTPGINLYPMRSVGLEGPYIVRKNSFLDSQPKN